MELREFKGVLRQVMIVPIAALLVLAAVLIWQVRRATSTVDAIERSDHRIAQAYLVQSLIIDEETGVRGYQVTGDPRFLAPYREASRLLPQAFEDLRATYLEGPSPHFNALVAEHNAWSTNFVSPSIEAIASGRPTSDVDRNLTGKHHVDQMRDIVDFIIAAARRRRTERIDEWHTAVRHSMFGLLLAAFAIGLFLALFTRNRLEAVSLAFRRSVDLERRRSEELFHSEQHLRTTLDSIGDGVITCDPAGHIVTINPVAQELTGWTEQEALSHPLDQVFHIINETTRDPVENPVDKVKRLDRVVGLANHTILIRKDGAELCIDDSGAPIRAKDGSLDGIVLVFRDVTTERRSRAALLANEKLAVAGRLAATIAHEIHNPLDSVSNILYLLQDTNSEEEFKHFLQLAQRELARVTQISRAMLSLYRESKAPVAIDLKETLEDILLLMERRFHDIGVGVSAELPEPIVVEGFPAELRQVFTNLIANAAEAAGSGGHLKIRVTPMPQGATLDQAAVARPGAIIEISDDGPGIPEDVRAHLFQPFFTTKGEQGTGLGLWVCQGIIRKHGGLLSLSSETEGPRHGAVATVFLAYKPTIDAGAL